MLTSYKNTFWGVVAGAVGILVIGLWGGFLVTKNGAKERTSAAVQSLLVQQCARDMFASPTSLALLKTKQPRDYDDAVRDEWKPEGLPLGVSKPTDYSFRKECGKAIEELLKQNSPAASKT